MSYKCPHPNQGDNGTIIDCIKKGHCGCIESIKREVKGRLRSLRLNTGGKFINDDPFFIYQQGNISKSKLLEIILYALIEDFTIELREKP